MPKSRKKTHRSGKKSPVRASHSSQEAILGAMINLVALPLSLAEHDYEAFKALEFPPGIGSAGEEATEAMRSFVLVYTAGGMEVFATAVLVISQTLLAAVSLFGDEKQQEHLPDVASLPSVLEELMRREVVPLPFYRDGAQWVEPVDIMEAQEMAEEMLAEQE